MVCFCCTFYCKYYYSYSVFGYFWRLQKYYSYLVFRNSGRQNTNIRYSNTISIVCPKYYSNNQYSVILQKQILFGIRYSEFLGDRILFVFGIRKFWEIEYYSYSVFGKKNVFVTLCYIFWDPCVRTSTLLHLDHHLVRMVK